MSFSSQVKDELSHNIATSRHCRLAFLASLITFTCHCVNDTIVPCIDNEYAKNNIERLTKLLNLDIDSVEGKKSLKLKNVDNRFTIDPILIERNCCKQAFIMGAFLATGSVTNPEKGYHFEIVCDYLLHANVLMGIIKDFGAQPKLIERKKNYVVYLKDASTIVDILNLMGAHKSLMNMENVRILKDMRNIVNRRVNCETANINKTVNAAVKQIEDIEYIKMTKGLEYLPPSLRMVASLRLEEPETPLKELGEKLDPPLGKSGVNHRLRKISAIASELKEV